jgi:hypothetical protein
MRLYMMRLSLPQCRYILLLTLLTISSGLLYSQITVESISELRALEPGAAQIVQVSGYYEPGDWGESRIFRWQSGNIGQDNGGTIIAPASNQSIGKWRMEVTEGYYNVKWFGARGKNDPDHNDHIYIMNCIDAAVSGPKRVYIPIGIYQMRGSMRLTSYHNGLEIFGEQVEETTEEDHRGFRTVINERSVVLKRADTGPYQSDFIILTPQLDSGALNNIVLRNLAVDGNRYVAKGGWHAILLNHREKAEFPSIILENIYIMRGGYVDPGDIWDSGRGSGLCIYGSHVVVKDILVYDAYFHGIGTGANATNVLLENVEVYDLVYQWSIDISRHSENVTLRNFYLHNGRRGMKTGNAKSVKIINGKIENNELQGFRVNTYGNFFHPVDLYMENVHFERNGSYGLGITEDIERAVLKNITAINNGSFNFYFTQPNINAFNLYSESYDGYQEYAVWIAGKNQIINNLIIKNSAKPALRVEGGTLEINGGEIINNQNSGIHLTKDASLYINHVKFGDNRSQPKQIVNELYGNGEVFYSGLDFAESAVSSENRINVTTSSEVSNIIIINPLANSVHFMEDGITFNALAASPNGNVSRIDIFVNNEKIGEVTQSPYIFNWQNMDEGEYTIHAVATFSNNTQEVSSPLSITVRSKTKTQSIYLNPGWNIISTYIDPVTRDFSSMMNGIIGNLAIANNNDGDVWWPSYDIYGIDEWNISEGYQVYMDVEDSLIITGVPLVAAETPVYLTEGWNIAAYVLDTPMPVETAYQSIEQSIRLVTNSAGEFYWPEYGVNTIGDLYPGQGYKIYTESNTTLIYPSKQHTSLQSIAGKLSKGSFKIDTITPKRYVLSHQSTGISSILLIESEELYYGDEIGVWSADGVLVGSSVALSGKAVVTVWGKNEFLTDNGFGAVIDDPLRLTLWSTGDREEYILDVKSIRSIDNDDKVGGALIYEPNAIKIVSVEIVENVPLRYHLEQNYPNPFNPSTTIQYELPLDAQVTLEIYNILGQKVRTLVDDVQTAGYYEIIFNSDNLASGVYFYRLNAGNYTDIKKMILLR